MNTTASPLAPTITHEAFEVWLGAGRYTKKKKRALNQELGAWNSGWYDRVSEGLDYTRFVYTWIKTTRSWAQWHHRRVWWATLRHNSDQPMTVMVAIMGMSLPLEISNRDYMAEIDKIFGARLEAQSRAVLEAGVFPSRLVLYEWLCRRDLDLGSLHVTLLKDTSEGVRDLAARQLKEMGEGVVEDLLPMLKARRADTRVGVARALTLIASQKALPAVEAALQVERSERGKEALRACRTACDPLLSAIGQGTLQISGVYEPEMAFSLNEGLTELRALVYEGASEANWVRICNLLERFRANDASDIAIDYLGDHSVKTWPVSCRPRPYCWSEQDALSTLSGPPVEGDWWVPIEVFFRRRHKPFLDKALKDIERRTQVRHFHRRDTAVFLKAIAAGWAWCELEGIPVKNLEVRVDGGRGWSRASLTTTLSLFHGFGIKVQRARCLVDASSRPHGLRLVRVKVPRDHALKLSHDLGAQRRYLDLMPILGLKQA